MTGPRIGSLFSGYGGLDMGVQAVLGGDVVWHCDIEPASTRLLAHHHPDTPNLGDITAVEWGELEPIDVLTGGFPCQDVSAAGRRAGMRPGTRSGLWTHMARAINVLRPRLVVIENVRGLLSAEAACDVEPCPWCLGDHEHRPLRALGAVLGDLAVLGYDARWVGVRAADAGAPHARYRVFIAGWPAGDTTGIRWDQESVERPGRHHESEGPVGGSGSGSSDSASVGQVASALPHAGGGELQRRRVGGVVDGATGPGEGQGQERQRNRDAAGHGGQAAADTLRDGREGGSERDLGTAGGQRAPLGDDTAGRLLDWAGYEPAIRRWELILGRVAPVPTSMGRRGGEQLSPAFVEWLMGLPSGHVTGVPGVSRAEQLKLLGNGVVPQQAELALRHLLVASPAWEVAA